MPSDNIVTTKTSFQALDGISTHQQRPRLAVTQLEHTNYVRDIVPSNLIVTTNLNPKEGISPNQQYPAHQDKQPEATTTLPHSNNC